MKKYLLLMSLLILPLNTFAGGWTVKESKVESVHYEGSFLIVRLEGGEFKLHDGCDQVNEVMLQNDTTRGDRQFSMLLAASMSGKSVSLYTSNCVTQWNKLYPKVWAVKVHG